MIDDKALKRYRKTEGSFGNRLHNSIDWKEGSFLRYEGRCAFLNEENLCDLYIEQGKDSLCPVSYTHLDVYKRQYQYRALQ